MVEELPIVENVPMVEEIWIVENVQKIEKISNCESQKYFLSNWTSYDGITLELIQIHSNFQFIL